MEEQQAQTLIPIDTYLQSGIHIGAKFKTGFMMPYIYKIRSDGLCVLNLSKIDEKIKLAAKMLSKYEPKDILIVCRRENGHKAAKNFAKVTGANIMIGRYLPGSMTNPSFEYYMEPKVILVSDPWLDKQVVRDGIKSNLPIIGLCDTNNVTTDLDLVIPCNNKGNKSLALVFYIIAREYLRERGVIQKTAELDISINDF